VRPGQRDGEQMSPGEMLEKIRQQQSQIESLKRQREILSLVLSNGGIANLLNCSPLAGIYKGQAMRPLPKPRTMYAKLEDG
jgi:hypothetical protein